MPLLNQGEFCVPSTTQDIDWIAFQSLQKQRLGSKESCIDAIEFALERVLKKPKRKAVGEQLARDLFSDGQKVRPAHKAFKGRDLVARRMYEYEQSQFSLQKDVPDDSLSLAVQTLKSAFKQLTEKEAIALYIRYAGINDPVKIKTLLGVSVRQYRNILNQSRERLKSISGFTEAYFLTYIHADEDELQGFFSNLIFSTFKNQLFNHD